ncbi:MAG: hypothetical protein IJH99_08410, partial [Eubacterium sp.]|nr:hypothetical protein [Eubacterium sp.]
KSTTSFSKMSLTDPESAEEYYLGTVGTGTAYCVPLSGLDSLTAYFIKQDGETWNGVTTFTFDAESIEKESDDTANYPLSEKETTFIPEEEAALTITNNTGMFKGKTASLLTVKGQKYVRLALTGSSYKYLAFGTYEEVAAKGDGTSDRGDGSWIQGEVKTEDGKQYCEFILPISEDDLDGKLIPIVSVSEKNYANYASGKATLEESLFPRQIQVKEKEKTIIIGDLDETKELTVTNSAEDLKIQSASLHTLAGPNSNNYKEELILSMVNDTFDKAFIGSAENAAQAEETELLENKEFKLKFRENQKGGELLYDYLEQDVVVSFHDTSSDTWKEYKFNASKENLKLTVSALAEDEEIVNPTPAPTPAPSNNDGTTAAVDSSTGLADGNYTPDTFGFSGGTGKLNITCTNIAVRGGQAFATLVFSSKNITYVKAGGGTYYTDPYGSGCTVEIPVELNKNNRIIALTTAMSTPHEVEYSIFPYLAAAAGEGAAAGNTDTIGDTEKLDENAPQIPGLTFEKEVALSYSEYLKVFNYKDGISLVEIDMTKNSVLDPDYLEKHKDENAEEEDAAEEAPEEESYINEETGEVEARPVEEYVAELYKNDIVKYLVVPEDVELPAGLEKQIIVIRKPVDSVNTGSKEAVDALEKLEKLDVVTALGMEEDAIENETLKDALKDEKVVLSGTMEKPDYRAIVSAKSDLTFLYKELLPLNEDVMKERNIEIDKAAEELTEKEYKDRLYDMTDRFATLSIPAVMDRSADEKDPRGAAEWILVYGILFDKEEKAGTILENSLKELGE